jgi:hypothetical protein
MTFLQKILVAATWAQSALVFYCSLWILKGEYLFSAMALLIFFAQLFDDYKKLGFTRMSDPGPLGRSYHLFRLGAFTISCVVNLVVYVRMASM